MDKSKSMYSQAHNIHYKIFILCLSAMLFTFCLINFPNTNCELVSSIDVEFDASAEVSLSNLSQNEQNESVIAANKISDLSMRH